MSGQNLPNKIFFEYKSSDIEWIFEIPAHWKTQRLKYLAYITFSNVDKHSKEGELPIRLCNYVDVYKNEYIIENMDFMEATATLNEIEKFALREGDVIVTKDSESWDDIAVPAYVKADLNGVICGYHLALIRPYTDLIDGKYLFRSFQARGLNDQFRVAANGITRYGLGKFWLDNSYFLVPPLPEQRAIAEFLDRKTAKIDELIAKKQQLIELLQEKRTALISHVVMKGLNPNAPMKDSGVEWLGEIPAHWKCQRNKWLFSEIIDRSDSGEEELLTVSHITGVTRRSEKEVYMFMAETLEGYKRCQPGDLVINTMWAWMGALGISPYYGVVSPSYNVYRLRKGSDIHPDYIDYLYRSPQHIMEINRFSKGVWSSRLRLYPTEFFMMQTPIPPPSEQSDIVEFLSAEGSGIEILITEIRNAINKLQEYRTSLIASAVTGKIDVRDLGVD